VLACAVILAFQCLLSTEPTFPRPSPPCASRFAAPARRTLGGPLFSYSYELLFLEALCFDNHLNCPGVSPCAVLSSQASPLSSFLLITYSQPKRCHAVTHSFARWSFLNSYSVSQLRTLSMLRGGATPPGLPIHHFSASVSLCASVANPMFSGPCSLFVSLVPSFPHSLPLFSIAYSLFSQNTRVGV
jgi:hypothetical protein